MALLRNVFFYRKSPDGVGTGIFRNCYRHLANRFVKQLYVTSIPEQAVYQRRFQGLLQTGLLCHSL